MEVAAIVLIGWILAVCFHEFGHAIVAYAGGDTTVKDKGYLTFNIFKYTDPGMTLFFPVLILILGGIGLPGAAVYIDHRRLRSRFWESAVAAAGPIFTLIAAAIFAVPFIVNKFPDQIPDQWWLAVAFLIQLQAYTFVLNLIPLPGLDGYGIIDPWLPMGVRIKMAEFSRYAIWVLFLLIWTVEPFNRTLWTVSDNIATYLHVSPRMAMHGYQLFNENKGWSVVALIAFLFLMKKGDQSKPTVSNTAEQKEQSADPQMNFGLAQQFMAENKPIDAIDCLNRALTVNPNYPEAWHLRGLCFALINRNDEAMVNFENALKLNPQYADCWYNKACCYALQGRTDEALRDLEQAIKLSPDTLKDHAKQDVGFRTLWNNPRFQKLVVS